MAKKAAPATKTTPAAKPAKALAPKVADPVVAAPAPAMVEHVEKTAEKSEVKGSRPAPKTAAPKEITYDAISKRAYEIYAGRGYAEGNPQADWLEAERQLRAGL